MNICKYAHSNHPPKELHITHVMYQCGSNLQAGPLRRWLYKYPSIVLFDSLHSAVPIGSSIYSFSMNNVAHLMSDGKIMASQWKPHISRSAQFYRRPFLWFPGTSCLTHTHTHTPGDEVDCHRCTLWPYTGTHPQKSRPLRSYFFLIICLLNFFEIRH